MGRRDAASKSARPARNEPVNAPAAIFGCRTSSRLTSGLAPCSRAKIPGGNPTAAIAFPIALAVSSDVPGLEQRFANERALRDAEERAANVVAAQIQQRLASYMIAGT